MSKAIGAYVQVGTEEDFTYSVYVSYGTQSQTTDSFGVPLSKIHSFETKGLVKAGCVLQTGEEVLAVESHIFEDEFEANFA